MVLPVLALLATSAVAGCGGGQKAGTARSTTNGPASGLHAFAQTYLRIVAPANAAHEELIRKSNAYGATTTKAQVVADLAPVLRAYRTADEGLLRVAWPGPVGAAVTTEVAANGALLAVLGTADRQNAGTFDAWAAQVSQDEVKATAAANAVRAGLGLRAYKP